jgi:hypothetical protein
VGGTQTILGILFSGEDRTMIRRAAMGTGEREQSPGPKVYSPDRKFPFENLQWNNNDPANRREMGDVRTMIIKRIREN